MQRDDDVLHLVKREGEVCGRGNVRGYVQYRAECPYPDRYILKDVEKEQTVVRSRQLSK